MKISFIIPCLNGAKIIENSVKLLTKKLRKINIKQYELILIDDGSKDETSKIVKKIKNKNIKLIINKINLGKSSSLIRGIKKSKYKNIIIWDCDLPYFECIEKVIYNLKTNHLVYINRRSKKSRLKKKNMNFYQKCRYYIGSIVCSVLDILLLDKDTGDTQAGLKGFKKSKNFNQIKFLSKKFFFDAELMILFFRSSCKMLSIPLKYEIYANSTIKLFSFENFVYLFELLKIILFYKFFKTSRLKF